MTDSTVFALLLSFLGGLAILVLKSAVTSLAGVFIKYIARVELLDAKLNELIKVIHDVPKQKEDLNALGKKFRDLEKQFEESKH